MTIPIAILVGIMTIVTILAFSFTVRGLLGVRFSLGRLVIAGIIAFALATPIAEGLSEGRPYETGAFPTAWFSILATLLSILAGMVFLVVAEILVPSDVLPGPIYSIRAFRRWRKRAARYLQITGILIRHGLLAYLRGGRRAELKTAEGREALARALRQALNEGGVTFVKIGQILSTRRDLLPVEFIDELSHLQTHADPVPWQEIHTILQEAFDGRPVDDLFASFDPDPLATASIAQVYTAKLAAGDRVVVKVRRPGITGEVERDLDIVQRLATMVQDNTDWGRQIGATDLAAGFDTALREELDFRVEARNLAVVAAGEARDASSDGLVIPRVYPDLSSARVLVMERVDGIPLGKAGPEVERRGLDGTLLARALLRSMLRQVVIDGTFHADPHPGNVMLLPDNRLTLLDFGSVGRIDSLLRGALVRLILAFDQGDPLAATDALLDVVQRPEVLDMRRLERTLGQFIAMYMAPGMAPDVRMFTDLFRIIADFGLSVPPEIAAVFRAVATLDGTLQIVAPGFNMIAEARAYATELLGARLRPKAAAKTLTDELITLLPMLRQMPRRLDRISAALEEGRLSVNVRSLANERDRRTIRGMLHEALLTVLASTAGVMAAILIGQPGGPALSSSVSVFQFLGYVLLVLALILAMRVLVQIFRPGT